MKVIIAGSRSASYYHTYQAIISCPFLAKIDVVISGHARGADRYGEIFAREMNVPVILFPADWGKYGKCAGFIRNKEMAKQADALIAVWDGKSKGTKHMIEQARYQKLAVFIYTFK